MNRMLTAALAALTVALSSARADDWPQWMGPRRDGVWRETGILKKFPARGPRLVWDVKIHGGFAGPAVAGGLVFVTDFDTSADIRSVKVSSFNRPTAPVKGKERVLCLNAQTGKEVWKVEYDCTSTVSYPAGPRCTPTVHDGKVYALGAMGNLYCLDAKKGTVLWSKDFKKDFKAAVPLWGFCGHPLIDGKKLICTVGGKDSLVVAFDRITGKEIWKAGNAREPGYSSPTIITAGGKRQLLLWDAEKVNAMDPETGKEYWTVDLKPAYGMAIMAPQKQGDYLFAGGIGFVSAVLKLDADRPGATEVWRGDRDRGLSPVNATPLLEGDTIYGVDQPGQLRAVDLKTGKRLWGTTKPTTGEKPANSGTGFLVKSGDRHFIFNEKGDLVIARLSRERYEEIDRARLLEPTGVAFGDRDVVWSHPAFAGRCVFARNDRKIVCFSLAE